MSETETKLKIRLHKKSRYHFGGIELRDRYSGRYLVIPVDQAADIADQLIYLAEELEQQKEEKQWKPS